MFTPVDEFPSFILTLVPVYYLVLLVLVVSLPMVNIYWVLVQVGILYYVLPPILQ